MWRRPAASGVWPEGPDCDGSDPAPESHCEVRPPLILQRSPYRLAKTC